MSSLGEIVKTVWGGKACERSALSSLRKLVKTVLPNADADAVDMRLFFSTMSFEELETAAKEAYPSLMTHVNLLGRCQKLIKTLGVWDGRDDLERLEGKTRSSAGEIREIRGRGEPPAAVSQRGASWETFCDFFDSMRPGGYDHLLVAMLVLCGTPRRGVDYEKLFFVTEEVPYDANAPGEKNYVVITDDAVMLDWRCYKENARRSIGRFVVDLSEPLWFATRLPELAKILKDDYAVHPRERVFEKWSTLEKPLARLTKQAFGHCVSIRDLRRISHHFWLKQGQRTANEQELLGKMSGHGIGEVHRYDYKEEEAEDTTVLDTLDGVLECIDADCLDEARALVQSLKKFFEIPKSNDD